MPVNRIRIPSDPCLNKISFSNSPENNKSKDNNLLIGLSKIENNIIQKEERTNITTHLSSIIDCFINIKRKLLNQTLPPASPDTELDNILSQGRALSDNSDTIYHLLNDKPSVVNSTISLKTKKDLVLGGLLLSSVLVGGGIYYSQRAKHQYHSDAPDHVVNQNPASLAPYPINSPFHSTVDPNSSYWGMPNNNPFSHRQSILPTKKNLNHFHSLAHKNLKKTNSKSLKKRDEKDYPCPSKNNKRKLPLLPYYYTTNQHPSCLTESFNRRCKLAHQQVKAKRSCYSILSSMILKIKGKKCLCPPPDWLDMKIIAPTSLRKRKTQQEKKAPVIMVHHPKRLTTQRLPELHSQLSLPAIDSDHDEIVKNRISVSHGYIIPQKQNLDTLPGTTPLPSDDDNESPDVKKVSLLECYNERENITLSKILRIISETINSPVATTLREGRIIIQYSYLEQGCVNNTNFYETSKNIESVIESLLSWIPGYNRALFITGVVSGLLETYSDALDGNEFNVDNVLSLNSQLLGLSKDVISSIKTKDINKISKSVNRKEIKDIVKPLEYVKNDLVINTHNGQKIKPQRKLNHLFDSGKNGFIFYDHEKRWIVDNNIKSNNHIRDTFDKSRETWKDTDNIYFFKNSSPDIYGDAIILRYHGEIYVLMGKYLYKANEIKLTDSIYRYLIKDDDKLFPIIHKGEAWLFEESYSPIISDELNSFLVNNKKIDEMLISYNVNHQDVSPLTPARSVQFDKDFNEYLKINNKYYKLKLSMDTSNYIEGANSLLALQLIDDKFHIKNSLFDGICCFHKEPINTIPGLNQGDVIFLDNTVITQINTIKFLSNIQHKITSGDITDFYFTKSSDIDGAIVNKKHDYIYYKNHFIKIHSNGDGTFTLGDLSDIHGNIRIYKGPESDTYFTIPKKIKKWSGLISKTNHCIVKKQPLSICNSEYFETDRIRYLLEKNRNQGVIINNHHDSLVNYKGYPAIYQKKGSDNELYYKVEGDEFFHIRINKNHPISFTPSFFVIYGKDSSQQIDHDLVITSVSVIKDFDTKKIIFSTPGEAQENVFDINKKISDIFLKWQEEDTTYRDITLDDLEKIAKKTYTLNDISTLDELFDRNGKKVITSIDYSEKIFKDKLDRIITSANSLEINNLKTFEETKTYPVIEDICSNAFKKTLQYIKDATTMIENSADKLDNYMLNVLKISDIKARNIFITSLKNKLKRMKLIFDENNKENIIIMARKKSVNANTEILSEEGKLMLGFTILNDPLDRIFINTAVIADIHESGPAPKSKDQLELPSIPQPDTPRRNRVFFINLISETMLHESIHALGSPEDYVYLNVDDEGRIDNIHDSIKYIETAINEGHMNTIKFEYLSKLYFMSNPLYKGFTAKSLNQPEILKDIFRDDSFFRAIVLLNNPDTISLLIRELAGTAQEYEA